MKQRTNGIIDIEKVSKIIGIQFSILSPEEIRKGSVAEITNRDTYINNKPVIGGLFDPRMGVLEPGLICPTDGHDYMKTPGYFGHIELARPVYHYGFLDTTLKALRCVCFHCSRITMEDTEYKFRRAKMIKNRKRRLNAMHALIRPKKKCDHCNGYQPKYTKVGLHVEIEYADEMERVPGSSGDKKQFLSAQKAVDIL